jgi:hypothetical protein
MFTMSDVYYNNNMLAYLKLSLFEALLKFSIHDTPHTEVTTHHTWTRSVTDQR